MYVCMHPSRYKYFYSVMLGTVQCLLQCVVCFGVVLATV